MNIVVCVKQVPASTEVRLDPVTNTIIRDGVESVINPFDLYAVEEAMRLKDGYKGRVIGLSMGIPSVRELLMDVLALGADQAVLLSDRKFAGADTLATSYALAWGIKKLGQVDLIICGKQAIDGDTAQVGPSLAEKLGFPHATNVRRIVDICNGVITCVRQTDDGHEIVELDLPAVITVASGINIVRLPSIKGLRTAKERNVIVWQADDIGADEERIGLKGSPTQVSRTFVPVHEVQGKHITGTTAEQARCLADILGGLHE